MGRLSGRGTTGLPEGIRFEHGSQTPPDEFNLTNDRILWCTRVGDPRAELLHREPKFWYEFTLRRNVKLFRIGGYTFEDDDTRIDPQSGREFFSTASKVDLNEFRNLVLEMLKDDPDAEDIADNYKTALREAVQIMPNTQFMRNKDEPQFRQIVQWTTMGARDNALIDAMMPVLEAREYDGIIRVLPNNYEYIFFYPRDCLRVTRVTAVEPVVGPAPDAGGPAEGEADGDFDEFIRIADIADDAKENDAADALLHMARGNAGAQAPPVQAYDNPAMYGPPGSGGQPAPPPPPPPSAASAATPEAPGGEAAASGEAEAKRPRVKNVPDKEPAEKDDTRPKKRGRGKALRGGNFLVPENNAPLPPGFLPPPFDDPSQLYSLHFVGPHGASDTYKIYSYNQAFRALMYYRRNQEYTVSMHTNGRPPPDDFAQALYMQAQEFGPRDDAPMNIEGAMLPEMDNGNIPWGELLLPVPGHAGRQEAGGRVHIRDALEAAAARRAAGLPPLIPRAHAGGFAFAAPRANAGGVAAPPVNMAAMLRRF